MTRKYTKKLLSLVDQGIINEKELIRHLLGYMSEADVEDFTISNEYIKEEEDNEINEFEFDMRKEND